MPPRGWMQLDIAVVESGREQPDRNLPGRICAQRIHIEFVHLLAQHHTLAGAQCLAPFVGVEIGRHFRLRQRLLEESHRIGARIWQPIGELPRKVFRLELADDALALQGRAGVVPGDGLDRRLIQGVVVGDVGARLCWRRRRCRSSPRQPAPPARSRETRARYRRSSRGGSCRCC